MRRMDPGQQLLVTQNYGLTIAVMQSLGIHKRGWHEARSEAELALCEAASTYDPSGGTRFSTWAWLRIRWALLDWLDKQNRARHTYENGGRSTQRKSVDEGAIDFDSGFTARPKAIPFNPLEVGEQLTRKEAPSQSEEWAVDPETTLLAKEMDARVAEALSGESEMTQKVGIMAFQGLTKERIAAELGVSVSTVARRRKEACNALAKLK